MGSRIGSGAIIGGTGPANNLQNQANLVNNAMRSATEDDIVVCHNCGNDSYIPTVRFAKKKIDLVNVGIGLVKDAQFRAICANCGNELPTDVASILTRPEREALVKAAKEAAEPKQEELIKEEQTKEPLVPENQLPLI